MNYKLWTMKPCTMNFKLSTWRWWMLTTSSHPSGNKASRGICRSWSGFIFKFGEIIWSFGVENIQNNHLIFIARPSAAVQIAIVLTNLRKCLRTCSKYQYCNVYRKVSLNQLKVSILRCEKKSIFNCSKYQYVSPVRCGRTSRGSPPGRLSRGWSKNQGGCNTFNFLRS